jgi:hypothetical protein
MLTAIFKTVIHTTDDKIKLSVWYKTFKPMAEHFAKVKNVKS